MVRKKKNDVLRFYEANKKLVIITSIILALAVLVFANNALRPDYEEVYNEKPAKGASNAAVTIVEYSDYQCPACKQAYVTVERILEEYSGQVKVEYKHFPLRTIHPYAQKAAEAAECANDQGKFWEYTDLLFRNSPALSKSSLKSYAKQLGIDASFDACLDSGAKKIVVDSDYNKAVSLGLRGTPSFFINDKQMDWNSQLSLYDNLKLLIDAELK